MPPEPRYNIKRIVIICIAILVIGGLIAFYFISKNSGPGTDTPGGTNNFPFPNGQGNTGTGTATDGVSIEETAQSPFTVTNGERLRRITDYPVTGFSAFERMKIVSEPKLDETTGETRLVSTAVPSNVVRFNIKQNGHVVDAEVSRDAIIVLEKSTTNVPGAEEVWFGTRGNPTILRTWSDAKRTLSSLVGTLPEPQVLTYCQIPLTKDATRGTKGTEVVELQKYLQATLAVTVTTDGSFGTKTGNLLKESQKALGIPETGTLNAATRTAINSDCEKRQAAAASVSEEPAALKAAFLQDNILRGTTSPDGSRMFFLITTTTGVTGIVANRDGTNQKQMFTSPFTEWMPQWVSADTITMTTLSSTEANGFMYTLNPDTGTFRKILGPLRGLVTSTSPDAATVLYSTSTNTGFTTSLYSVATGAVRQLDLATIASKCGWRDAATAFCGVPKSVANSDYPDAWYQGIVLFEDNLWSVNGSNGSTALALPTTLPFDITQLGFSPDKNYVFFINKTDQTLWSYRLNE